MPIRIDEFEFDDFNEAEMARHDVKPSELQQILESGRFSVFRNRGRHARSQPYLLVGLTDGGRLLEIPLSPKAGVEGVWRPATAYTP